MSDTDERFAALRRAAERDPNIEAFWLDGSRGKGFATAHSDYDCTMLVKPDVFDAYRARYARHGRMDVDVVVMTLDEFREHAAWGGPQAWQRYNYVRLRPLVDKTGQVQALLDAKGRVPPEAIRPFVEASLDGFINHIYRAMKCQRDGHIIGGRLEAAGAVPFLLNTLFALHDGRLRPYDKYLEWELDELPLGKSPWPPKTLLTMLLATLTTADIAVLQALLRDSAALFRGEGYGSVFDGWGQAMPWMLAFSPA